MRAKSAWEGSFRKHGEALVAIGSVMHARPRWVVRHLPLIFRPRQECVHTPWSKAAAAPEAVVAAAVPVAAAVARAVAPAVVVFPVAVIWVVARLGQTIVLMGRVDDVVVVG